MTLTNILTQLKADLERSGVYIDSIDEKTKSIHLTFKTSKQTSINVSTFVAKMKRMAARYGFKDVQIFTKFDLSD